MNKYKVIAICGKSAAGKDKFLHILKDFAGDAAHEIISHTTRPPREGEIDGVNYHFVSDYVFTVKEMKHEMLEVANYREWRYGTAIDALNEDKVNIGVFNRKGVETLMKNKDIDLYLVQMCASGKTRLLRSLNRETHPDVDEIIRRYMADEEEWKDFNFSTYEIHNDYNVDLEPMTRLVWMAADSHWTKEIN